MGDDKRTDRAFIGSFTSSGGRGIVVAAVEPATGALTEIGVINGPPEPSYLTVDHAGPGPVLYAVSETAHGSVAAYDITGPEPGPLGAPVAVQGDSPTRLSVVRGHPLTANYASGSVTVLPLGADGGLRTAGDVRHCTGSGPDPARQSGPHAHQVLPDPSRRWVLGVDLGADKVWIFSLTAQEGRLVPNGETSLPPGTGPRHLAFHPSGSHAYIVRRSMAARSGPAPVRHAAVRGQRTLGQRHMAGPGPGNRRPATRGFPAGTGGVQHRLRLRHVHAPPVTPCRGRRRPGSARGATTPG